ncbi:MAG: hypothetical protein JW904_04185 [Spirochaetales bacterium]|nr:hypothetical protein [Spirochaetales bacterium]
MSEESTNLDSGFSNIPGNSDARPDTDISGMDPLAAKEYVLAFITTLKQTQNARAENEKELLIWLDRVKLAESSNELDLASRARDKVAEIELKITTLKTEEAELGFKVGFLKDELSRLKSKFQATVDVDLLLAQFEMLVGKPDTTAKAFKDHEAEQELEELKKKLQNNK